MPCWRAATDQDERVRSAAVEHLPYLEDPRVLPALAAALHGQSQAVRAAAARALGQLESAPALPHLLAALEDRDAWVRYFAARSVGQHRYPQALDALVQLAQADPAGHVRIAALEALGQIGGARAVAPLIPWTQAADLDIARAAMGALATIDHPDALPPLLALLQAPEQDRRIAAIRALAKRGGAEVVDPLQRAASADPQIAQAAIEALSQSGSDVAVAALVGLTADATRREAVSRPWRAWASSASTRSRAAWHTRPPACAARWWRRWHI